MDGSKKAKDYILGLAIGTFWLIAASTGFACALIYNAWAARALVALGAIGAVAGVLLLISLTQILGAVKLPKVTRATERPRVRGRFFWIVVLEVVGIALVNGAAIFTGNLSLLVPVDLIIVGVHFFPLAKLFDVPRYIALGAAFCLISVLTIVFVSPDAHTGGALSRFLISSLGCTVAAWLIAIGNMLELRRLLSEV